GSSSTSARRAPLSWRSAPAHSATSWPSTNGTGLGSRPSTAISSPGTTPSPSSKTTSSCSICCASHSSMATTQPRLPNPTSNDQGPSHEDHWPYRRHELGIDDSLLPPDQPDDQGAPGRAALGEAGAVQRRLPRDRASAACWRLGRCRRIASFYCASAGAGRCRFSGALYQHHAQGGTRHRSGRAHTAVAHRRTRGRSHQGRRVFQGRSARHPVDRKSTRLNSSHVKFSYAVFCLKKKICIVPT